MSREGALTTWRHPSREREFSYLQANTETLQMPGGRSSDEGTREVERLMADLENLVIEATEIRKAPG